MPIIEMFVPEGALDAEQKAALHRLVGRQVTEAEGGSGDSAIERALTWMFITECRGDAWSVGGEPVTQDGIARYFVRIAVPSGSMNDAKRHDLAARVNAAIGEAVGRTPGPLDTICVVEEIPAGNWSGGGIVVDWRDIMRMIDREEHLFGFTGAEMAAVRGLAEQRAADPARGMPRGR
jgi:phenylpyruvate tautomerase PptA (4-oxalocrotonate tautomerase family)